MDPKKIAEIINQSVKDASYEIANKTFYRAIVTAIKGTLVQVTVEGGSGDIPNVPCMYSYKPAVGDKVLMLSIGLTGTNFLVIDKIADSNQVINLITNPSFETNTDGWTVSLGGGGRTASFPPQGTWAYYLQNIGGGRADYSTGNLISGKQYNMSYYVTHSGNSSQVIFTHNGSTIRTDSVTDTFWVRKSFTFTATANAPLGMALEKAGADQAMYIDGLQLTEGSTLYSYFDGSVTPARSTTQWDGTAHASTSRMYTGHPADTWIIPSYQNSWVRYDGTWSQEGYLKDRANIVHLRGLIKSGTIGSSAFTLPVGYRPASQLLIGTISNNAIGRVAVYTNGQVIPQTPSTNAWVALDGITFVADQ